MKIILLLTMSLCAVHCSDILVKVIQEVHIGNCGRGCSKCKEASSALAAAEEKLTELQEEQTELENQVTAAEQTESSVSDAGEAVTNVTDAISGSRRRHRRALIRHRRQAASFTYTSCEDSSSITSSVEDATLAILQGIISALQTIAGGNLNSDTLDCYVALAGDLVDGISDGSLEIPDNTSAIESLADEVTAEVTTTSTAVQEVKEELIQTLEEKKAEVEAQETVVESSGGTVEGKPFHTEERSVSCNAPTLIWLDLACAIPLSPLISYQFLRHLQTRKTHKDHFVRNMSAIGPVPIQDGQNLKQQQHMSICPSVRRLAFTATLLGVTLSPCGWSHTLSTKQATYRATRPLAFTF